MNSKRMKQKKGKICLHKDKDIILLEGQLNENDERSNIIIKACKKCNLLLGNLKNANTKIN